MEAQQRERWAHKREYVLAVAGNVVGLGNVWRFPYLCYKNGGGVFLVPYLLFAALVGVPVFLQEAVIGQFTQEGSINCWRKMCPLARGVGFSILLIQLYSRLYNIVLAWALFYLLCSFSQPLPWSTCNNSWNTDLCVELTTTNWTTEGIRNWTGNWRAETLSRSSVSEFWERRVLSMSRGIEEVGTVRWELLLCLLACTITCYFCVFKGVRSTGKVVYFTAVFPYVTLAVLLVRGVTLPGAGLGVAYYLYPDLSRLADPQVWMEAGSQVLFSYGLASGTLITLGSYNKVNNNCYRDSLWLCVLNSGTSFVVGFAVFSALGFMAHKQGAPIDMVVASGSGLAFIAFPQALAMMPLPQLWAVCFFLMLLMLGLDSLFAGLETITAAVVDIFPKQMKRPWSRELFLIFFLSFCFLLQVALTTEGGIYQFQLIDHFGANGACLLFVCVVQCVAAGWAFGAQQMCEAVEKMTGQKPSTLYKLCWRYITPLICVVYFFMYFMDYQPLSSKRGPGYPDWAYQLGWAMALSTIFPVPAYAMVKMCTATGGFRQRLSRLWRPLLVSPPKADVLLREAQTPL